MPRSPAVAGPGRALIPRVYSSQVSIAIGELTLVTNSRVSPQTFRAESRGQKLIPWTPTKACFRMRRHSRALRWRRLILGFGALSTVRLLPETGLFSFCLLLIGPKTCMTPLGGRCPASCCRLHLAFEWLNSVIKGRILLCGGEARVEESPDYTISRSSVKSASIWSSLPTLIRMPSLQRV